MPGLSGVGISFGADRIFDVLNQLDLYPKEAVNGTRLLFVNFGEAEAEYCLPILAKVRSAGTCAEIFPDSVKMKKQNGRQSRSFKGHKARVDFKSRNRRKMHHSLASCAVGAGYFRRY